MQAQTGLRENNKNLIQSGGLPRKSGISHLFL